MNELTRVIVVTLIVSLAIAISFTEGRVRAEERICNNAGGVLVERACINRKALIDIRGDYR